MKLIDFEAHALTPEFAQAVNDMIAVPENVVFDFGALRIKAMASCGCTMQVLSYPGKLDVMSPETAAEVLKKVNDNTYTAATRFPEHFRGYAVVPVNNNAAAVDELERCKNELGLVGWFVHSNYSGRSIDDNDLLPLVYKAAELGMHIYLHPASPQWERFKGLGPIVDGGLGFHVDPALTLLRLICKGVLDKYPDLKILLGHYGEALPFMIDRIDSMNSHRSYAPAINEHPIGYYFDKNIWVTTSGNFSKAAFNCTKERLGIEHMLFGSDFPTEDLRQTVDFLNSVGMTETERERLFYRNAEEFFGIG